ncbi:MAG: GreA/GreB family elongation factor [Bacteroidota bacterium]
MKRLKEKLILLREDYQLLISCLQRRQDKTVFDRKNAEDLQTELKNARLVNRDNFPADVVRLNSIVRIKTEGKDEVMELVLVTPEKAAIKEKKISIMAPIGTALIGFRKGQKIKWRVPAGNKTFTILDVVNDMNN